MHLKTPSAQDIVNETSVRGDISIKERAVLFDPFTRERLVGDDGKEITGKVVGEYDECNIVFKQGKRFILQAFAQAINSQKTVRTIKIGNDVGAGGTVLSPTPPTANETEAIQTVVYETPVQEFFVSFPNDSSVRFLATINGANVMTGFPTQPNVIYTSASIYTLENKSVTYKRFPARTISSLISVDISWTITLT